jgi:hypothetical protein
MVVPSRSHALPSWQRKGQFTVLNTRCLDLHLVGNPCGETPPLSYLA